MKFYGSFIMRALLFLGITVLLAGLQTTFWYQLFGSFPSPMLWLIPCLYLSLYRNQFEALIIDYGIAFAVAPFTIMPLSTLLIILICLTVAGSIMKRHIYWRGSRVFASFVLFSVISFQALYLILAWFLENKAALEASILGRIAEASLSYLIAFPLFYIFSAIDELMTPAQEGDLQA